MMPATDVVILTENRYITIDADDVYQRNIATEERLVADALRARGLRVVRRAWSDASIEWETVRCALFRSTWDYFHRFAEFSRWLTHVSARTQLFNPAPLLRWNIDKHYLAELAAKDVAVVPTEFDRTGSCRRGAAVFGLELFPMAPPLVFTGSPGSPGSARKEYPM